MNSESLDAAAMDLFAEALEQPPERRTDWLRAASGGNERLQKRVEALLLANDAGESLLRTGGAGADHTSLPMPERIGAYRITGLIGEGGMGAVYRGERDAGDFEHSVAIKVIRAAALREDLIARFEQERQILARLNHPNIARLFDGGRLDDGSPFMVMELAEGSAITDWAQGETAAIRPRLERFLDLCKAVQHAHQNLIIHRDLTPSNVLVTPAGVVKLIDFGIAKPHAADEGVDSSRLIDSRSYTPGFAAPERNFGAAANVLSDVYSLGKILDALTRGCADDRDLAAIIARATAFKPADRYPACDALSKDVAALLSGHAVAARKGGRSYEIRKFIGRHTLSTALSLAAVLALVGGLITVSALYRSAEANRAAADARFNDVRSLANYMMFDLYDAMEKVPGNTVPIASLAQESQSYIDSLSADDRTSLDVRLEAVRGYKRLADIMGNSKNMNLGDQAETSAMLSRALEEAEKLKAAHPGNPDVLRTFGEVAFSLAVHAFVSENDSLKAERLAKQAAAAYESVTQRPDATFDDQRQFLRAYMMSGVAPAEDNRHEQGLVILKDAHARCAALRKAHPDRPEARDLLGSISVEIARALVRYEAVNPEAPASLPYWDDAIRLRLEADAQNPEDKRPYRSLATLYYERAAVHRSDENYEAAFADLERGRTVAETMLAQDPNDDWLRKRVSGIEEETVKTLSLAGRHDEALVLASDVLKTVRAEVASADGDRGGTRAFGYSLVLFADVYARAGETRTACALTREARQVWDAFEKTASASQQDKAVTLSSLETLESNCTH